MDTSEMTYMLSVLSGFVSETGTFIAELAEDENDTVVRSTRNLKKVVESVAGSIENL